MKLIFNIFLLFSILFISGCSSKRLTIKSLHPSKIEGDKIHTIRVERFYRDDINQTVSVANKIANKIIDFKLILIRYSHSFNISSILI